MWTLTLHQHHELIQLPAELAQRGMRVLSRCDSAGAPATVRPSKEPLVVRPVVDVSDVDESSCCNARGRGGPDR